MIYIINAFLLITMGFSLYDGNYKSALVKGIFFVIITGLYFFFQKLGDKLRKDFPDINEEIK